MNFPKLIAGALFAVLLVAAGKAQTNVKVKTSAPATATTAAQTVKSSAAYAEVLLRKTELEAELEDLLIEYTDEFPKVKEDRFELSIIQRDFAVLLGTIDTSKLTLALGKLIVRRAELATDLWAKQKQYGNDHPDVKRAKRKVETFDKAIGEILQ